MSQRLMQASGLSLESPVEVYLFAWQHLEIVKVMF